MKWGEMIFKKNLLGCLYLADKERARAGDEDLDLAIYEVDWELASRYPDTIIGVEDVADILAFIEASVWYVDLYLHVNSVGEGHEEPASGVGVEVVVSPLFGEGLRLGALGGTSPVDGLHELVELMVLVHVGPERLSVGRVFAARVALLAAVVEHRNTPGRQREGHRALEQPPVWLVV